MAKNLTKAVRYNALPQKYRNNSVLWWPTHWHRLNGFGKNTSKAMCFTTAQNWVKPSPWAGTMGRVNTNGKIVTNGQLANNYKG